MTKEQIFLASLEKLDTTAKNNYELLKQENKFDEANFEKIKRNVYQIYIKMFRISMRSDNLEKTFTGYLQNIPQNWKKSLEEAKINNDFETEHIEIVKLETINEIEDMFKVMY